MDSSSSLRRFSDEQLVECFCGGEDCAFEELVARYEVKVYRIGILLVKDASLVEEVLARVFSDLYQLLIAERPTISGGVGDSGRSDISTGAHIALSITCDNVEMQQQRIQEYLYARAISHARDIVNQALQSADVQSRCGTATVSQLVFSFPEEERSEGPLNEWTAGKLLGGLKRSFQKMPEDYKIVFLLHDIMGLSKDLVARILGRATPDVQREVCRTRLVLKTFLKVPSIIPFASGIVRSRFYPQSKIYDA